MQPFAQISAEVVVGRGDIVDIARVRPTTRPPELATFIYYRRLTFVFLPPMAHRQRKVGDRAPIVVDTCVRFAPQLFPGKPSLR